MYTVPFRAPSRVALVSVTYALKTNPNWTIARTMTNSGIRTRANSTRLCPE